MVLHRLSPTVTTLLALLSGSAYAQEQQHELPAQEVTAQRPKAPTSKTVKDAAEDLKLVPGGATLIDDDAFRSGRVADISDILKLAPSVYVQSRFGASETRLSVRGSGIRRTFNVIGVKILRDGVSLSEADGNVRPQLVDPLNVEYVEVFPGANGLFHGSSLLGGAINFVSPTGYTADSMRLRTTVGSFNHTQTQFSTGRVLDNGHDYYVSGSMLSDRGFRDNGEETQRVVYGNYGFPIDDVWAARIYVTGMDSNLRLPGSLTMAQLNADPTQADAGSAGIQSGRYFNLGRVDAKLTGSFDGGDQLDISASTQWLEMNHPLAFAHLFQDRWDSSASVRYQGHGELFGNENEYFVGAFFALGDDNSQQRAHVTGNIRRRSTSESSTIDVYGENRMRVSDELRVVTGVMFTSADRGEDVSFNIFGGPSKSDETYTGVSPKLGFIYDQNESLQYFGNISRSFEPPTDGDTQNSVGALDEQTATTLELGARSQGERTSWQGTVYYSMVEDEILTVEQLASPGMFETGNADDTIHFGVELGVQHLIPLAGTLSKEGATDRLRVGGTVNFSKFEFDGDSTFGDNDIPGIPSAIARLEAVYEQPDGFYVGLNAEHVGSWETDFTNTLSADSFTVFGATAGYNGGENWRAFVDARNITDKEYASNSGIITDAGGADSALFNPGLPFALYFGVEITL